MNSFRERPPATEGGTEPKSGSARFAETETKVLTETGTQWESGRDSKD